MDIVELNSTINQLDIIDICRLFHSTTAKYTFFSSSHGMFTKTDHLLSHNTYLNKFYRIEIIQCMLSDHRGIKLETNNGKIFGNPPHTWRLNNDMWVKGDISREVNINENTTYQNLWDAVKAVIGGKFIVLNTYITK